MADGTKYNARAGTIEVDRPDHAAAIRSSQRAADGHIAARTWTFHGAPGRRCGCGFDLFAWQTVCPRCGHNPKEDTAS
jgi:hypothetical protein